ncbi:hypothetical protein SERLA73DRAFT_139032 [Serpula lacrymans var. lacrymans S7.3]|uniref:Uncharacterized protein n=2 Tax=Serpula lacrymans var. lacrymans TaxID=341189 RepID=F8Q064_SERL3|nr:uncharacterized protein SERLADRAFT_393019 [Serpula lacrymans var. lacrymans S7.9]EGN98536.1 hypothetical protein SERLA73DRAFT_139032 [Serpula lacrymans var. lacrymans S7.3]EGO24106.1 hypothetical protein SERLADRAFT_393019 [Serpula lacrymans var. lacrymans S7.9]
MPITRESHTRADAPSEVDRAANTPQPYPSEVAPPTVVDTLPQQASTSPGDGSEVQAKPDIRKPSEVDMDDPNINVVVLPAEKPSFKQQVFGYAQVARGTAMRKPSLKERGENILRGEESMPSKDT